ncbi:MAG: serine/threonine protein kinase [Anaerolineae bacterium]|nr:serine/threonine protein kinase [Anaerolineae bacterium]
MALPKGTRLYKNRYQISRLLARGGFGFIYLAYDALTSRQVVLKELIPALISDADAVRRFIREGRTLQRLKHPNIVRAEAMFTENGHHYLVLEYLEGGVLTDWLKHGQGIGLNKAVTIALALCNAVGYLHEMGITHCDLQPGNVLFDGRGQPKLIDLGIAHVSDSLVHRAWQTERNLAIGTVFYMSPEQLDGVRNDPRVDLYALSALLYEMLSGQHYLDFDSRNTPGARADNVNRVRNDLPAPIKGVPGEVNRVILRALSKSPQDRQPNVKAFAHELTQVSLPYLSPADAIYLASLGAEHRAEIALQPQAEEWPRWVWIALALANLGIMLTVGILLFI